MVFKLSVHCCLVGSFLHFIRFDLYCWVSFLVPAVWASFGGPGRFPPKPRSTSVASAASFLHPELKSRLGSCWSGPCKIVIGFHLGSSSSLAIGMTRSLESCFKRIFLECFQPLFQIRNLRYLWKAPPPRNHAGIQFYFCSFAGS